MQLKQRPLSTQNMEGRRMLRYGAGLQSRVQGQTPFMIT
jgi:hypothetical protein